MGDLRTKFFSSIAQFPTVGQWIIFRVRCLGRETGNDRSCARVTIEIDRRDLGPLVAIRKNDAAHTTTEACVISCAILPLDQVNNTRDSVIERMVCNDVSSTIKLKGPNNRERKVSIKQALLVLWRELRSSIDETNGNRATGGCRTRVIVTKQRLYGI